MATLDWLYWGTSITAYSTGNVVTASAAYGGFSTGLVNPYGSLSNSAAYVTPMPATAPKFDGTPIPSVANYHDKAMEAARKVLLDFRTGAPVPPR